MRKYQYLVSDFAFAIDFDFQHPRIGGPGLVGRFEFPDGYAE